MLGEVKPEETEQFKKKIAAQTAILKGRKLEEIFASWPKTLEAAAKTTLQERHEVLTMVSFFS